MKTDPMLQIDRQEIERFSEMDLTKVLETSGWEAILPNGLTDRQLVSVSDQLRGTLWGEGTRGPDGEPNGSIAMALLLMAKADPSLRTVDGEFELEGRMAKLHDVLMVLSMAADREIVSRILNRPNKEEASAILNSIESIMVSN